MLTHLNEKNPEAYLNKKNRSLLKQLALQMQISISCLEAMGKSYGLARSLPFSPRSQSLK